MKLIGAPAEVSREYLLELIRTRLQERSLSIVELENRAAVSRDCVRDFLRGKTYMLRGDKLQKVLAVIAPEMRFP